MKRLLIALACLGISACMGSGRAVEQTLPSQPVIDPNAPNALASLPASGLGPQTLQPGECGLFLWSQTDPSKFIFFAPAVRGTAIVSQAEGPIELLQTNAGGDIFGQFNTELSYAASNGSRVDLSIEPGDELEGGQRISSGLLTTTGAAGWVTKLPVLGVRACQQE